MGSKFKYEVFVNGLLADSKPTRIGALALVANRFNGNPHVEIKLRGEVIWSSFASIFNGIVKLR